MSALQLRTRTHGGGCTVEAIGPITHHTTATLRGHLRRLLDDRPGCAVELDLRCCTHMDIHGLLALDVAHQVIGRLGGQLRLVRVPPLIERLIRQHSLSHLLDTEDGYAGPKAAGSESGS